MEYDDDDDDDDAFRDWTQSPLSLAHVINSKYK
jgi:hypothetical protein